MNKKGVVILGTIVVVLALASFFVWRAKNPTVPPQKSVEEQTSASAPAPEPKSPDTPSTEPTASTPKPLRLYGTVMDISKGVPVAGATVLVATQPAGSEEAGARRRPPFLEQPENQDARTPSDRTDESGAYSLLLDDRTNWKSLACVADGYARETVALPTGEQTESRIDFTLRPGGQITGKVTDASTGQPIEGMVIEAVDSQRNLLEALSANRAVARTDAAGEYTLTGLPLGSYRIRARARQRGYLFQPEQIRIVELTPEANKQNVDFALEPGAIVRGTVTDTTRKAISRAQLNIIPGQLLQSVMRTMETMSPEDFMALSAQTDEEGKFEIKGLDFATDYRLRCEANGYAETLTDLFRIEKGQSPKDVDMILAKGSVVAGTAKFPDGKAAAKRIVTLTPELSAIMSGKIGGAKTTTTQEDGTFRFENVSPGNYTLQPMRAPLPPFLQGNQSNVLQIVVEPEKDVLGLELVLQPQDDSTPSQGPQGVIQGTVLDPSGKPAAKVRVEARAAMIPNAAGSATTNDDGTFTIERLAPLSYSLHVSDEKGVGRVENVSTGSNVTIRLVAPATVSGVVVDAEGNPAASCRVMLQKKDTSEPAQQQIAMLGNLLGRQQNARTTDSVGFFEFKNVDAGRYTVEAKSDTAGTGSSAEFTVAPGQTVNDLRIVLEPGSEFSGTVEGPRGEAVAGARVSLVNASTGMAGMMGLFGGAGLGGTSAGSATTDDSGSFRITRVPPGDYVVNAVHSDYARFQAGGLHFASGRNITGYRIRLTRGGKATGRVVSGESPRPGVIIYLVGPAGVFSATTDSTGAFSFDGIPPGRYTIQTLDLETMARGATEGFSFRPRIVDIGDNESVQIELGNENGVPVTGRISVEGEGSMIVYTLRKPGGPAPESLNIFDMNQMIEAATYTVGQGIVGADGTFRLPAVEPGNYILDVYAVNMNPQRPPDVNSMLSAFQTPVIRQEITVGDQPVELNLTAHPSATP